MPQEPIAILLNLVPDHPSSVIRALETQANLARQQDQHGYSLLHAAASYGQKDLLEALVRQYHVDPNITDEDGETPLFTAEDPAIARALLDLGADPAKRNNDGLTAEEKIEAEGEFPLVAALLRAYVAPPSGPAAAVPAAASKSAATNGVSSAPRQPPPLPSGDIKITTGYMPDPNAVEDWATGEPDPEIRRRIEELAASDDFQTEEGQRRLRELVTDVVGGLRADAERNDAGGDRSRRRVEE